MSEREPVRQSEAWPEGRWTFRQRLKAGIFRGDKRDYEPGCRVGRWWVHWERRGLSFDAMLKYGALWIEVFCYV